MYKTLQLAIHNALQTPVPSTGLGLFRIFYGLVTLQEIVFLLYFNHLIFDPIPYIDVEFPMIPFFLCFWGIAAVFLVIGYRSQFSSYFNYIFWIAFVQFTPMQRDFDGGFDSFMIGAGFFLIFLPIDRAFSFDNLRNKLAQVNFSTLRLQPVTTSLLAYYLPIGICLGFLYFDSAIHKMFAEYWRNGLGAWLPSSMPYYISAIDMSWLLNIEFLQKTIGYTIIIFQFAFPFVFFHRRFRVLLLIIGAGLHLGITLTLNIYPFGLGMLIFYFLLIPFSWWRAIADKFRFNTPQLVVFYDEQCPLCNRTAIIINHFDICKAVSFKGLQTYRSEYPELKSISYETLLTDLYTLTPDKQIYSGIDTYIQILLKMRYTYALGMILRIPGIYYLATRIYRHIADNRQRNSCDDYCVDAHSLPVVSPTLYYRFVETYASAHPKRFSRIVAKILMVFLFLQFNSSLHYGLIYRLGFDTQQNILTSQLKAASNSILMLSQTFLGISPHALYLHDHFEGYNDIISITYLDKNGDEKWLPFVNSEGRMVSPNWGRVHSMWANIAVTPNINKARLEKFIMKVTAFWGIKLGLDINTTEFTIKLKKIKSPTEWRLNLRRDNLSGQWLNIGTAKWVNNRISVNLPNTI